MILKKKVFSNFIQTNKNGMVLLEIYFQIQSHHSYADSNVNFLLSEFQKIEIINLAKNKVEKKLKSDIKIKEEKKLWVKKIHKSSKIIDGDERENLESSDDYFYTIASNGLELEAFITFENSTMIVDKILKQSNSFNENSYSFCKIHPFKVVIVVCQRNRQEIILFKQQNTGFVNSSDKFCSIQRDQISIETNQPRNVLIEKPIKIQKNQTYEDNNNYLNEKATSVNIHLFSNNIKNTYADSLLTKNTVNLCSENIVLKNSDSNNISINQMDKSHCDNSAKKYNSQRASCIINSNILKCIKTNKQSFTPKLKSSLLKKYRFSKKKALLFNRIGCENLINQNKDSLISLVNEEKDINKKISLSPNIMKSQNNSFKNNFSSLSIVEEKNCDKKLYSEFHNGSNSLAISSLTTNDASQKVSNSSFTKSIELVQKNIEDRNIENLIPQEKMLKTNKLKSNITSLENSIILFESKNNNLFIKKDYLSQNFLNTKVLNPKASDNEKISASNATSSKNVITSSQILKHKLDSKLTKHISFEKKERKLEIINIIEISDEDDDFCVKSKNVPNKSNKVNSKLN